MFPPHPKIIKLKENVVGWYHTHPNYGPWLSGIDVSTQRMMQNGGDPFIAIVLDPIRTHISGKVDIGAFRTCPEESHPGWDDDDQIIPEEKVKDFGLQYKQYYKMDVSYYMSDKDNELIDVRNFSLLTNRSIAGRNSGSPYWRPTKWQSTRSTTPRL